MQRAMVVVAVGVAVAQRSSSCEFVSVSARAPAPVRLMHATFDFVVDSWLNCLAAMPEEHFYCKDFVRHDLWVDSNNLRLSVANR